MMSFIYTRGFAHKMSAFFLGFSMVLAPFASLVSTAVAAAGPSADLSQAQNGGVNSAVIDPVTWVSGAVNEQKGHYTEGESIPYQMVVSGLTANQQSTLIIGFDVIKSQGQTSKFAIDYITSNDRIGETVDPCSNVASCSGAPSSTYPVPPPNYTGSINGYGAADVLDSFNTLVGSEGTQYMKMWGGTINSVSYTTNPNLSNSQEARVTVTFTPASTQAVLSWGGHISSSADYPGESAVTISGSPYHTRLISIDGKGGNQDMALSASAVNFPGNLIVVKHVVGGSKSASDFTLNVNASSTANPAQFAGDEAGTFVTIDTPNNGTTAYTVTEQTDPEYAVSYSADCTGTVAALEQKVCTVTNTYVPPTATLTLVKEVDNGAGGTAVVTDWTLSASGPTNISGTTGSGDVTAAVVTPGQYTLSESTGPDRYSPSEWSCVVNTDAPVLGSTITLQNGDIATCTITNTYVPPAKASITVEKTVINDNGGTATPGTFQYFVNSVTEIFSGVASMFDAVTPTLFTLTETNTEGYTPSVWGGDCAEDGTVTLGEGESATCTITNDDIAPQLTVIKVVENDNTYNVGTKTPADFTMNVSGTNVSNASFAGSDTGVTVTLDAGQYSVTEGDHAGYNVTYSADCSGTIGVGEEKTCTVTNNDIPPTEAVITVNKVLVQDFGGTKTVSDFSFELNGADTTQFEQDGSNEVIVTSAGAMDITEVSVPGYSVSYDQCSFDVELGASYSCTITNTQLPACSDGIDNDGDGQIDYPNDTGCSDGDDNSETPTGTITIDKVVEGEGANNDLAFSFDVSLTGSTTYDYNFLLSGSSTPEQIGNGDLEPGTYTITELDAFSHDRWNLGQTVGIVCSGVSEGHITTNSDNVVIDLPLDGSVSCTFTNTYTPRDSNGNDENIVIRKEVTDGSDTSTLFDFTLTDTDTQATLAAQLSSGLEYDSGDLTAGHTYSISEDSLPLGWSLDSVSCTSTDETHTDISASAIELRDGETVTCVYTNDQELFEIYGRVWNDGNENDAIDEEEGFLEGWTVRITDGEKNYSTTTDADGNYRFYVPRGTWTITEDVQSGWAENYPDDFQHIVTVPAEEQTLGLFDTILAYIIPTAHAAVNVNAYGSYDFGNHVIPQTGCTVNCGGGGNGIRISLGGGTSDNDPEGEVLGDTDVAPEVKGAVAPVGAPNTGMGGAAGATALPLAMPLLGMLLALIGVGRRN